VWVVTLRPVNRVNSLSNPLDRRLGGSHSGREHGEQNIPVPGGNQTAAIRPSATGSAVWARPTPFSVNQLNCCTGRCLSSWLFVNNYHGSEIGRLVIRLRYGGTDAYCGRTIRQSWSPALDQLSSRAQYCIKPAVLANPRKYQPTSRATAYRPQPLR
jgi:hypothetical protein